MGSELGDDFREWNKEKQEKQEKRHGNAESSIKLLESKGVEFKILNAGNWHILVVGRFDFWPSTGKWRERKTGRTGRGVFKFLKVIGQEQKQGGM